MVALILAGGTGTRLHPITEATPKVMLPVAGRPFLEYHIEALAQCGVHSIVLCVGHLGRQIQAHFGDGAQWGVHLRYLVETRPLGTGGAIRQAAAELDKTFLVLNGDSFVDLDYAMLFRAHRDRRATDPALLGTLVLSRAEETRDYGLVEADGAGRIVRFDEKANRRGSGMVNAGVYVFDPAILALIPAGRAASLEREVFPAAVGRLAAFPVGTPHYDIGTPERYRRAQEFFARRVSRVR